MRVVTDGGKEFKISQLSLTDWRRLMSEFMSQNPNAGAAWDILGCIRGPDSPSEREDMERVAFNKAYQGRRERKYRTVEIIREAMFFGVCGGGARHHKGDHVVLPPKQQRDHFDRHVARAARALGIGIEVEPSE